MLCCALQNVFTMTDLNRQSIEPGRVQKFDASAFKPCCQNIGQAMNAVGDGFQTGRAMIHRVERTQVGKQYLRGTDIRVRLFTANMLLTGLQSHTQRLIALGVNRNPDDSTRNRALVSITSGEESGVWATKAHRNPEVLGIAQYDVCTHFAWRFDLDQSHQVTGNSGQCVFVMQCADDI